MTSTMDGEMPAGWVEYLDPASGCPYYHNAGTGETTWTHPGRRWKVGKFFDSLRERATAPVSPTLTTMGTEDDTSSLFGEETGPLMSRLGRWMKKDGSDEGGSRYGGSQDGESPLFSSQPEKKPLPDAATADAAAAGVQAALSERIDALDQSDSGASSSLRSELRRRRERLTKLRLALDGERREAAALVVAAGGGNSSTTKEDGGTRLRGTSLTTPGEETAALRLQINAFKQQPAGDDSGIQDTMESVDVALREAEEAKVAGVDAGLAATLRTRPWDALDDVVVEEIVIETQVSHLYDQHDLSTGDNDDDDDDMLWSWPLSGGAKVRAVLGAKSAKKPQSAYFLEKQKKYNYYDRPHSDDFNQPSSQQQFKAKKTQAPVVTDAGRPPETFDGLPGTHWRWLGGWRSSPWSIEGDASSVGCDKGRKGRRREWTRTRALVAPPSADCAVAAKLLDMRTKLAGLELLAAKLADQLVVAKLDLDKAQSNAEHYDSIAVANDRAKRRLQQAHQERQALQTTHDNLNILEPDQVEVFDAPQATTIPLGNDSNTAHEEVPHSEETNNGNVLVVAARREDDHRVQSHARDSDDVIDAVDSFIANYENQRGGTDTIDDEEDPNEDDVDEENSPMSPEESTVRPPSITVVHVVPVPAPQISESDDEGSYEEDEEEEDEEDTVRPEDDHRDPKQHDDDEDVVQHVSL